MTYVLTPLAARSSTALLLASMSACVTLDPAPAGHVGAPSVTSSTYLGAGFWSGPASAVAYSLTSRCSVSDVGVPPCGCVLSSTLAIIPALSPATGTTILPGAHAAPSFLLVSALRHAPGSAAPIQLPMSVTAT